MPRSDKYLHIITEACAVFIVSPILIYIGLQQQNSLYKYFLIIIAVLTILLDGYLLYKYKEW